MDGILEVRGARIYLGALVVAPREDAAIAVNNRLAFQYADLGSNLRETLKEIFTLPSAQEIDDPQANDLAIDVTVLDYQAGDSRELFAAKGGIQMVRLPSVTVHCRVYSLITNKTIVKFSITKRMKLSRYVARILSWRSIFRFYPKFDAEDMESLLQQACRRLLVKVQRAI